MFLSAHEIAHSREHALSNFLSLSATYFNASQRLSELLSTAGREAIEYGGKQLSSLGVDVLAKPEDVVDKAADPTTYSDAEQKILDKLIATRHHQHALDRQRHSRGPDAGTSPGNHQRSPQGDDPQR